MKNPTKNTKTIIDKIINQKKYKAVYRTKIKNNVKQLKIISFF